MGARAGMKLVEELDDVEAVIIDPQNQVHVSSGLTGKIVKRGDPTPGIYAFTPGATVTIPAARYLAPQTP